MSFIKNSSFYDIDRWEDPDFVITKPEKYYAGIVTISAFTRYLYHLEYDGHCYSVLYTRHGMPAMLKATMSEIRICDENNRLLCKHLRSYRKFPLYIIDEGHMPPEHVYFWRLHDCMLSR